MCARLGLLIITTLMLGCSDQPPPLLGTLEWDRIAVVAEVSEPVLHWAVAEGDYVEAGAVLLELDGRRLGARLAQAESQLQVAEARLRELSNGARPETIDAIRAALASARAAQTEAEQEYQRIAELRRKQLIAAAVLDQATANRDQRRAATAAAEAQLLELTRGTRAEQIEQAIASVTAAQAGVEELSVSRERLIVRAPRAGRVDALPFKPGDQPHAGASLASLLVGEAPYARLFIPASQRPTFAYGDTLLITVEGIEESFTASLRSIQSEASFTPYYALAGDDASRLVYRAELVLKEANARTLPAGLPVTARRQHP